MPKSPSQLDREIDEALLRQKGQIAYGQAHTRVGDSSDVRLGPDAARAAALKVSARPRDQEAFVAGWLAARAEHLGQREQYHQQRGPSAASPRQLGYQAYNEAHSRIGDSTDVRLGPSGARHAARKISARTDDQEEFMEGWLAARERHLLDRARYTRQPYVPLPLPEFPLPDD